MAQGTPSWLNLDFTERILRMSEDDSTIQVIDIFSKPATSKGDNYTSDMIRVSVEFTHMKGDQKVNGKKSLIFKFEPIDEGTRQDLIQKIQIFDTEIIMMTDTLRKMNRLLYPEPRVSARALHIRMERPLCLILEDLAPLGFRMADRQAGLDLAHTMLAIQGLAKFHASSVALCEKEPKHKAMYRKGMFSEEYPPEMTVFFTAGCVSLADEVDTWPELGKPYGDKLRALSSVIYQKGVEAVKRNDNEFNVINHGDCWVNNMLFRYDDAGKPIEHIFVDFQLSIYTSPAIDLLYFLNTSPSIDVFDNSLLVILEEYVRTLTSVMKKLGCKTQPPTMQDITRAMKERAMYGLISTTTVLPAVLVDKSEAKDIDEMLLADGTVVNPGFKNPLYRRIMTKKLPRFMELGMLDP